MNMFSGSRRMTNPGRPVVAIKLQSGLGAVLGFCTAIPTSEKSRALRAASLLVALGLMVSSAYAAPTPAPQFSAPVNLGNPFTAKKNLYARNVWDMQLFEGKIFLAHGDSAANSGATPIFSLDPKSGAFASEYRTNSEQVDCFPIIDGKLLVPDHDPLGAAPARLYRRQGGAWSRNAGLPDMAHLYAAQKWNGVLYTAGGNWPKTDRENFDIWSSKDDGVSWTGASKAGGANLPWVFKGVPTIIVNNNSRTYSLLPLGGQLYGVRQWMTRGKGGKEILFKLNAKTGRFEDVSVACVTMSPGFTSNIQVRYKRTVPLRDGSALALLVGNVNDHQWNPLQLLHLRSFSPGGISKIAVPDGALPYDLLQRDKTIYVLAWNKAKKRNLVYALDEENLSAAPREVLSFNAPTFARSFEEVGGAFYFGLGSDSTALVPQTGEIWKVSVPKIAAAPTPETVVAATPVPAPVLVAVATPIPTSMPTPVPAPDPAPQGLEFGLRTTFYPNKNLTGTPLLQRVDGPVALSASNGVPTATAGYAASSASSSNWSVRWEGQIEAPISGEIVLMTRTGNGLRFWFNNQLLLDDWNAHTVSDRLTGISVERGRRYPIRIEYAQNGGTPLLELRWSWNDTIGMVPREYLWHEAVKTSSPSASAITQPVPIPEPVATAPVATATSNSTSASAPLPVPTPKPAGYSLFAPQSVSVRSDVGADGTVRQSVVWIDDRSQGQFGYKVEQLVNGKWKELRRGQSSAQRELLLPVSAASSAPAPASFRVRAYKANVANGPFAYSS